jgi:hypothetical protein
MPGVALHFVLAQRALERWERSGVEPPFDPGEPRSVNAFYHGAIGPDLGYLPGGHRPLSELAHSVRTGALTRSLISSARTPAERAFAWGWLTHVIADREIHPWIGRGVGQLLTGCQETFIVGASEPLSHLRVELGVDCWYAARHREIRAIRLTPVFDDQSIAFLEQAYRRTYGLAVPRDLLLQSHRRVGRRAGQALASMRILGALMDDAVWPARMPGVRWLLRTAYHSDALRGISLAFLNPVAPSPWLLDGIEMAAAAHTDLFMEAYRSGGREVTDCDLDTGAPLVVRDEHASVVSVLEA